MKPEAVNKYYLTAHYRTMYLREPREKIGLGGSKLVHPDLHRSRIRKNETDVRSLVDLMENSWLNPMRSEETELVSISTGTVAPADVATDLLRAHQIGEDECQTFAKTRLEQNPPTLNFHDAMKKHTLKTFANVNVKTVSRRGTTKDVVLKAERNLFSHMILVVHSR